MTFTTARLHATASPVARLATAAVMTALVGLAASQAQAQPAGPAGPQHAAHHRMGPGMGAGGMMGMPGMAMPERLLDDVGASADQKTRLRDIFKAAGDDMRSQHEAGRALHDQMRALLAAPQVDAAAAEALRQQQLARHDAVTKRALQAMLDAQAVLTPEHRAKLAERMASREKMMERGNGHRGHAGPKG